MEQNDISAIYSCARFEGLRHIYYFEKTFTSFQQKAVVILTFRKERMFFFISLLLKCSVQLEAYFFSNLKTFGDPKVNRSIGKTA